MTNITTKSLFIAVSTAVLFASGCICSGSYAVDTKDKNGCKSSMQKQGCKGKSACKGKDGCKGKSGCNGKGGCKGK